MTSPLVNCPQCAATLNTKNMAKHLSKVHNIGGVKIIRYGKVSGERVAQWLAKPAEPLQVAIIRPRKPNGVVCILCGVRLPKGGLLEHKEKVHGERKPNTGGGYYGASNTWVTFVSGGLPGLGRRR